MSRQLEGINSEWLVDVILKSENIDFVENTDLQILSAVPEGDNFCSNIYRLKLKCRLASGSEKNVSAICKQAPKEGTASEDISGLFEVEIKVYSTVLPLMSNLMEEFSDSREKLWCELYGEREFKTLVFEDLIESGFTSYSRVDWLLEADTTLIMKELGRFHAMSRILLERGSFKKEDYATNNLGTDSEIWGKLYEGPLILLAEAMTESWSSDWKDMAHLVKEQVPIVCSKMTDLINSYDRRFEVFNHGDLWACNVMKKCGSSNDEALSVRFIDFQLPSINSFIMDVAMVLHYSVDPSVRRNKIDTFLSVYATSLIDNLQFFDSKSYQPSLEDVKSEYKRIAYIAFVFGVIFLPTTTSKTSEPFKIDKVRDHPAEEIYDKNCFIDERIVRELKEDLKLFEVLLH